MLPVSLWTLEKNVLPGLFCFLWINYYTFKVFHIAAIATVISVAISAWSHIWLDVRFCAFYKDQHTSCKWCEIVIKPYFAGFMVTKQAWRLSWRSPSLTGSVVDIQSIYKADVGQSTWRLPRSPFCNFSFQFFAPWSSLSRLWKNYDPSTSK